MLALTIPTIFFKGWFWLSLMAIVIVIHYFWGKTPPPPKPSKFFAKHKKTIYKIANIFLIFVVSFAWVPIIYFSTAIALESIFNPSPKPEPLSESLRFALAFLLIGAIPASGTSGALIGLLSVFHSNLTKGKRTILLIASLLPLIFTILLLLINYTEKPEDCRSIIRLGLGSLAGCWIINGPAIIVGKHFVRVAWSALRILKLVSGDFPA